MSEVWVAAAAAAVVGAGATIYGASMQSDANKSAANTNANAQAGQNNAAWNNYLLQRGLASSAPVATGSVPTPGQAGTRAVNTRLPLWASINVTSPTFANQPGSTPANSRFTLSAPTNWSAAA